MTYLLHVNALVAPAFANHEFHPRVTHWLGTQESPDLATCSITELGLIRVLVQAPAYGITIAQARNLLLRLKAARPSVFTFLSDDHDSSYLPEWVKTPKQITDGHLLKLASTNGRLLATLGGKTPGAYLIPRG